MIFEGRQVILVNEYKKENGFYKWFPAEEEARKRAQEHANIYVFVIFACCREIYMTDVHAGGVTLQQVIKFQQKNRLA